MCTHRVDSVELLESDIAGIFAKASPTHVETVLSNEAMMVGADTATARARTVLARMREPDGLMTHGEWGISGIRAAKWGILSGK